MPWTKTIEMTDRSHVPEYNMQKSDLALQPIVDVPLHEEANPLKGSGFLLIRIHRDSNGELDDGTVALQAREEEGEGF